MLFHRACLKKVPMQKNSPVDLRATFERRLLRLWTFPPPAQKNESGSSGDSLEFGIAYR